MSTSREEQNQIEQSGVEIGVTQSRNSLFNISGAISRIQDANLAKKSRYSVSIIPNASMLQDPEYINAELDSNELVYYCESAELPGRALGTTDVRIYGPSFKMPFVSAYNEITLTLLCDLNLKQKKFLDFWMNYINPTNNFFFKYRDTYTGEIQIKQYSETGETTARFKLIEAYPVTINPMPTSWAEDNFHRVQVSFTYRYWEYMNNE